MCVSSWTIRVCILKTDRALDRVLLTQQWIDVDRVSRAGCDISALEVQGHVQFSIHENIVIHVSREGRVFLEAQIELTRFNMLRSVIFIRRRQIRDTVVPGPCLRSWSLLFCAIAGFRVRTIQVQGIMGVSFLFEFSPPLTYFSRESMIMMVGALENLRRRLCARRFWVLRFSRAASSC